MRAFRKTTINDVAALAGVSASTVSYFVSGRSSVCSEETGRRIQLAVEKLNYTPSSVSCNMHRKATRTIGLYMLPPIAAPDADDSFFLERLWRGFMRQSEESDYSILHYPASVRASGNCDVFLDGRVDGLLFHPDDESWARRIVAAGMPTVLVTGSIDIPEGCGAVWANESHAVELALSHLWDMGHRRIAFVAGPVGDPDAGGSIQDIAVNRLNAYAQWMASRRAFQTSFILHAGAWASPRVSGLVTGLLRLPNRPTAILCTTDMQALSLIAAVQGAGLTVPADMSVVGIDNSPLHRDHRPYLTSVDIPLEHIGAEAIRTLLRLMSGAPLEECRVAVQVTSLVERETTAPPKRVSG
jgi:LacI family transcriptional regulator